MKNKYIIHLLDGSAKSKRRFREFVASPYHNKNGKIIEFLDLILAKPSIDSKKFHALLFKGQPFKEQQIIDLYILVGKLYQKYLSISEFEDDEMAYEFYLIKNLDKRSEGKLFSQVQSKVKKHWEGLNGSGMLSLYNYFMYDLLDKKDIQASSVSGVNLQKSSNYLDRFYISNKLRHVSEMINRSKIVEGEYDLGLYDDFMTDWSKYKDNSPLIKAYLILIELLTKGSVTDYNELLNLLITEKQYFSDDNLNDFYGYLQNYCVRKINEGEVSFYHELFSLFKFQIEANFLTPQKTLTERKYKTIITVGLRLNEYKWTEEFIQNYSHSLTEGERENALNYNLSVLNYEKGNFKTALRILSQVKFTDIFYNLDSRILLLKIYFKLEEYESLESSIIALGVFLRRTESISGPQKKMYMNFVKFLNQILKLRWNFFEDTYIRIEQIESSILKTKHISNRNWLLEELKNLTSRD
jgi:hypothetical protein